MNSRQYRTAIRKHTEYTSPTHLYLAILMATGHEPEAPWRLHLWMNQIDLFVHRALGGLGELPNMVNTRYLRWYWTQQEREARRGEK